MMCLNKYGSTKVDGPSVNYAQGAKNTLGNDVKTQKLSGNGITKVTILTFQNLAKPCFSFIS